MTAADADALSRRLRARDPRDRPRPRPAAASTTGPGISIKLSALHPRYSRAQVERVMAELCRALQALAAARAPLRHRPQHRRRGGRPARALARPARARCASSPELAGWNGIGFVVQAYQKRCPCVVDWLIDLARRSRRRLMVRLVKGAYWDSEIKRAQVDGLDGYPVFTRKVYTDVSYLACAQQAARGAGRGLSRSSRPTTRTRSRRSTSWPAPTSSAGQYEFQCLHGMGEPLYEQVVGRARASSTGRAASTRRSARTRRCSPTWCAACSRTAPTPRSSTASPTRRCRSTSWSPIRCDGRALAAHRQPRRRAASGDRRCRATSTAPTRRQFARPRSRRTKHELARARRRPARERGRRRPGAPRRLARRRRDDRRRRRRSRSCNPADRATSSATSARPTPATSRPRSPRRRAARRAGPRRRRASARRRARARRRLARGATLPRCIGLLVREAGKTCANAVAEVREAVDFLRYYARAGAARLRQRRRHRPLGPVVCISPWNFPLAIFTGQVAAALAAGNPVLAKPAEQTPLIAAEAVRLLHARRRAARRRCSCCPGAARRSARRWSPTRASRACMFTGSTEVARLLQKSLAGRLDARGRAGAADRRDRRPERDGRRLLGARRAGRGRRRRLGLRQRRPALLGAARAVPAGGRRRPHARDARRARWRELAVGDPAQLAVDVGPVIDAEARAAHRAPRRGDARARPQRDPGRALDADATARGTFVAPTLIEIDTHRRARARGVRPGAARAALPARATSTR